jgi:hypothetical protein
MDALVKEEDVATGEGRLVVSRFFLRRKIRLECCCPISDKEEEEERREREENRIRKTSPADTDSAIKRV